MNLVILMGRLAKDVELKTSGNTQIVANTLAVDGYKDKTDFISIKAFGKTAIFMEKYMKKGSKIVIEGSISTGSYEKNGQKVYTTEVLVNRVEFAESKRASEELPPAPSDNFESVGYDDSLPFN